MAIWKLEMHMLIEAETSDLALCYYVNHRYTALGNPHVIEQELDDMVAYEGTISPLQKSAIPNLEELLEVWGKF